MPPTFDINPSSFRCSVVTEGEDGNEGEEDDDGDGDGDGEGGGPLRGLGMAAWQDFVVRQGGVVVRVVKEAGRNGFVLVVAPKESHRLIDRTRGANAARALAGAESAARSRGGLQGAIWRKN